MGDEYEDAADIWAERLKEALSESEIRDVIKDYTRGEDLDALTDLTEDQITLLTVMESFTDAYPGLGLEGFPKLFKKLRISFDGRGRKQVENILSSKQWLKTAEEREEQPGGY